MKLRIQKKIRKEHKKEPKAEEERTAEEEQETPVFLVTQVNNLFSSFFSNFEQQQSAILKLQWIACAQTLHN